MASAFQGNAFQNNAFQVVVLVTASDTGSGVDAKETGNPLATLARSEIGSGVDTRLSFLVAMARSEVGGGVDGHKALAPQSVGEIGTGVDAILNYLASLTKADSGVGVDTLLTHLASLLGSDIGAGLENILGRDLVIVEPGSGVDVSHLFKDLILSDGGTCVLENSYLRILQAVKHSSDLGSGLDISGLDALFQRQDSGEAIEQILARAIFAEEYPAGAVDLANILTATITGEEVGTGVEQSLKAYYQKTGEAGVGAESSILDFIFKTGDYGSGAEAITILAVLVASDTGQAVETVLSYFRKTVDSGQGEEVVHLIGAVGRAMRLLTYLKHYCQLIVYTSEVKK